MLVDPLVAELAVDADSEGGGAVRCGGLGYECKTAGVGLLRVITARRRPAIGGVGDAPDGDGSRALGREPPVGAGFDGHPEGRVGVVTAPVPTAPKSACVVVELGPWAACHTGRRAPLDKIRIATMLANDY